MLTFFARAFVHAFPSIVYFFLHRNQQVGIRECCGELLLPSPGRAQRRQLHDFGLKGMGLSPDPHRRRMPWTAEKECVPGVVHGSKEKMVLDVARRVGVECVDRASQVYPLEALRAAVATCEYNTFRGKNIFDWSIRWNPMYSGNGFTARSGRRGRTTRTPLAPSFISVATVVTQPAPIRHADFPRWHALFCLSPLFPHPRASVQTSLSMHVPVACGHTPID
ncbi:hypothetical protein ECC02_006887 [Trypanosoma cruzi]|uniref:Uncharacterized protein n=1 Tax=Trypanosoma cruzi TaxID=5693 RepID=A0A7J6Y0G8_TRYCR|nr:hypothetical protein ECC02_006887 [Trypanosoma cruzi]